MNHQPDPTPKPAPEPAAEPDMEPAQDAGSEPKSDAAPAAADAAADAAAPSGPAEPAGTPSTVQATGVAVRRRRTWLLPPTSVEITTGTVTLAVGTPDDRHTLLALIIAGRLAGAEGHVTLDGKPDRRGLQRHVALVDVPGVTSPEPVLPVRAVVGEELAMAGLKAWASNVKDWLADPRLAGAGLSGDELIGDIDPAIRVHLMTELALLRHPRFTVLALPERHGALPQAWWPVALEAARRGTGVLVTASRTAAAHLTDAARTVHIGPDTPVVDPPLPEPDGAPATQPVRPDAKGAAS